jgi:hypothetical protein
MVRNEADLVEICLRYHLALGVDHVLVIDNGSVDGTDAVLERLSREPHVTWWRDDGPFRPAALANRLVGEALARGADWILPFDADEFWDAPLSWREWLAASGAGAVRAEVVNFIQRREQGVASPGGILHMTRRTLAPRGPLERCEELVEDGEIAFIEMLYPPKWLCRAGPDVRYTAGYHAAEGVDGPRLESGPFSILHAPLRSRRTLDLKAEHGRRIDEADPGGVRDRSRGRPSWHVRRFHRLQQDGSLDREWEANSYQADALDVRGRKHPVVFDPRLRDRLQAFVAGPDVPRTVGKAGG